MEEAKWYIHTYIYILTEVLIEVLLTEVSIEVLMCIRALFAGYEEGICTKVYEEQSKF